MTSWSRRWTVAFLALGTLALTASWGGSALPRAVPPPVLSPVTDYARAVEDATAHGLTVWIEADLVKRWLASPGSFQEGVQRVTELAAHQHVAGIKIADELGYHDGLDSPELIEGFLADTAAALRAAAPGKLLLVDLMVPMLGCMPGHTPAIAAAVSCADGQASQLPGLALAAVDRYLASGDIDVLDLSTGLRDEQTYRDWGVDIATAQRDAWHEAQRRGWGGLVRLQARKALAHPGPYAGTAADAETTADLYLDIPLATGASAVDVWTWRQAYEGDIVRLVDPGLAGNDLWSALAKRRANGARLFTHMSPHSLEIDLDSDLRMLSTVFSDVFLAAGTG
jgi:hypothetical protein